MGRGLSENQEQIIRWAGSADRGNGWGADWDDWRSRVDAGLMGETPSRREAISRALSRALKLLEMRGLVRMRDWSPGRPDRDGIARPHAVHLTDEGWDIYRRLTLAGRPD